MNGTSLDRWLTASKRTPLVMGVLNVTPDSFSDGGRFATSAEAAAEALAMSGAGADIIDIGGESTRPGSLPVPEEEQIAHVVPVIQALRNRSDIAISIDTTRAGVASAACDAGANLVNDISAGDDPGMFALAAERGTPIILVHMQGSPRNMQEAPAYADVTAEVAAFLRARLSVAEKAGIRPARVLLDPGIGFGKNVAHNLTLLRDTSVLAAIGNPLVIGASRKWFIGQVVGTKDALKRGYGGAAIISWVVANGAAVLRVHDVGSTAQVVRMTCAIMRGTMAAEAMHHP